MAGFCANPQWRDLYEAQEWHETYGPALPYADGHANPCCQIAPAKRYRRLTLWEDNLQGLNNQLNPAVFFNRQKGDDLGASGNQDGNDSGCGGIHGGMTFVSV